MTSFAFEKKIKNHWQNIEALDDDEFFISVYHWLVAKGAWEPIEYNFLSWLKETKGFSVPFNTPLIPQIKDINQATFSADYGSSARRLNLIEKLKATLAVIQKRFKLNEIFILVGGSFTEISNSNPTDIDVILIVPNDCPTELHESFLYGAKMIESGVDLKVLPANYSISQFKSYSNIIHLGNRVKIKDSIVANNEFTPRTILRISDFSYEKIT